MAKTALYRFFDADGKLLYVGITERFGQRWTSHAQKKPWWDEVHSQTAEWCEDRPTAAAAEKAAIRGEGPKYNVVHVAKPPRPRVPKPAPRPKVQADMGADYWTIPDIAEHWGVSPQTIRSYRSRGRGELPPHDKMFGRTPAWRPKTVLEFQRPGKGARTDLK